MLDGIFQTIIRPQHFFKTLHEDKALVSQAFWVVLIVALLASIVGYFGALPSSEAFPEGSPLARITLITAPIFAIIFTFIAWFIYGLLARIGAGVESKPWAVVAYAFAPQIIILTLIVMIAAFFPIDVTPITAQPSDGEAFREANIGLQKEIRASFYSQASTWLGYVSVLWQLALIFLGLQAGSQTNKAIRGTILVGILAIGFSLLPILLAPS